VPGSVSQGRLDGLAAFTTYAFVVRAINGAGEGAGNRLAPVESTGIATPALAPAAVVALGNLSSLPGNPTTNQRELTLAWAALPPEAANGPVEYVVVFDAVARTFGVPAAALTRRRAADSSSEHLRVRRAERRTRTTNITLTGLQPATVYNVSVAGVTAAGRGPLSAAISIPTSEGVPSDSPSSLRVVVEERAVILAWLPLQQPNGVLLGYTVQVTAISGGVVREQQVPGNNATVEQLQAGQTYAVAVAGRTAVGQGPFTPQQNINIPGGASADDSNVGVLVGMLVPLFIAFVVIAAFLVYRERKRARRQVDKVLAEHVLLSTAVPYDFKKLHEDLRKENEGDDTSALYGEIHRSRMPVELSSRSLTLDRRLGAGGELSFHGVRETGFRGAMKSRASHESALLWMQPLGKCGLQPWTRPS
jgi:hypothetical protein